MGRSVDMKRAARGAAVAAGAAFAITAWYPARTSSAVRRFSRITPASVLCGRSGLSTFSTAGSDGTFHFWDKDAKHRLKGYPSVGGTISSTAFNRNGNVRDRDARQRNQARGNDAEQPEADEHRDRQVAARPWHRVLLVADVVGMDQVSHQTSSSSFSLATSTVSIASM